MRPNAGREPRIDCEQAARARQEAAARPCFVIVNVMVLALGAAAWRAGLFAAVPALGAEETAMLAGLAAYAAVGFAAAFRGRWETARHIANGVPMWALGCTGLGMLLAVDGLRDLTPAAMAEVFRNLAFAISPNIAGVVLMAWLRELIWWCGGEPT
ncbi:MAG TPA: hypothetical protein VMF62_17425 [Acetobacteraceae bacterium]|jgi:hypothetical protein|nr:hypothetical protein [Acetobacteraceae bacterium]